MTVSDYWNSKLPDYYPTMYLDGYEPWQIMQAHRNTFNRELKEKQERALAEKELNQYIEENLKITFDRAMKEIFKDFMK